jgi:iron complex outermembrane recepter protein
MVMALNKSYSLCCLVSTVVSVVLTAGSAKASASDPVAEQQVPLDEIVVTAQKREERLGDIPMSIVAVGGDELDKRQITNIDDLAFAVPGLYNESTGWQRRISLQGVFNGSGLWPTIGMYLDEADVTTSIPDAISLNTFDLARVEVLKGPQGTLYGEGSEGGAIRFITKAPDLHAFEAISDTTALFTENGAPSQRINTVFNVPLVDNELGFRVAGLFDHEGGWINQPAADRKDISISTMPPLHIPLTTSLF